MSGGCEFYADALVERAAGTLDVERAARLDAHLAGCADCAAAWRAIRALKDAPLEVPANLEDRIRRAVREAARPAGVAARDTARAEPRRAPARWRPWALPLAAAAALVGIWIGLGGPGNGPAEAPDAALVWFDDYDPYGAWPAEGVIVAGDPLLSELSMEELEHLLQELES
jgi:anti-sigma factor RsiW